MKTIAIFFISIMLGISNCFGQIGNFEINDTLISEFNINTLMSIPADIMLLDSVVAYQFVQQEDSVSVTRYIYIYDEIDNSLLTIFQYRTPYDQVWTNYNKSLTTFNDDNLAIEVILYSGEDQSWIKRDKIIYEYNSNNEGNLSIRYFWDTNIYEWKLHSKNVVVRTSASYISISSIFDADNQQWEYGSKTQIMYGSVGEIVSDVHYWWSKENLIWENDDWVYYTYEDGVESSISYSWDSTYWKPRFKTIGIRINSQKVVYDNYTFTDDSTLFHTKTTEYIYDNMDNIIAQESYRFLLSDSIWIGDRKFEKVINEEGQLLFTNNYSWVHDESKWVNSNNIFYGYNEYGINDYKGYYTWDTTSSTWLKSLGEVSYYSNSSSINASNFSIIPIQVHPNPCINQITLNFENMDNNKAVYYIYSQSGELIDEGNLLDGEINVANFNTGIYFLRLSTSEKTYSGKFVKL